MVPTEPKRPGKADFDALPGGTPPPGLDTRIKAHAAAATRPAPSRRFSLIGGAVATVVLAVFVVPALRQSDTAPTAESTAAPVAAIAADAAQVPAPSAADTAMFSRPSNAVAAVADTRNKSVVINRTLGQTNSAESATLLRELAAARTMPSAESIDASDDTSAAKPTVPALQWWQQILTLIEHGHVDKARREFALFSKQHPLFSPPDDTPDHVKAALGLPETEANVQE